MAKKKKLPPGDSQLNFDALTWVRGPFEDEMARFLGRPELKITRVDVLHSMLMWWTQATDSQRIAALRLYWDGIEAQMLARHSAPLGPEDAQQVVRKAQAKTGFRGGRTRPG